MIRLAMCGTDEISRSIVARLRRAVLSPLEECDAVVVLDDPPEALLTGDSLLLAGKSVLLSADLCPSLDSFERWLQWCRRSGSQLGISNAVRYLPSMHAIKEQAVAGKLGAVGMIRLHHWETGLQDRHRELWLPNLDLAAWLADATVERIYATNCGFALCQMHLGFASGAMALIDVYLQPCRVATAEEAQFFYGHGYDYRSLHVIGSGGAAYLDDHSTMQLHLNGERAIAFCRSLDVQRARAAMVQEFVDGLESGRDLSSTVTAWRQTLAVADAVQRSLATEQAVRLESV